MKTKREEGTDTDDNDPKRRKLSDDDAESSPLPVLANDNPLLPLASYSDDDEEEMVQENGYNNANQQNGQNTPDDGGDDDDDEEDHVAEEELNRGRRKRQVEVRRDCPYLDTVNRQVLNFDFEKFCSVSLSNLNVYACLVCGKYYQGRGRKSHAYTHSLEAGHHVYINLETEKVYCLPDGYEISDPSLDDIRHVLYPRFNKEQVLRLDKNKQWSGALDGSDYLPGMVGLNNVKERPAVDVELWEQAAGVKKNYVKGLGTKRKYSSAETCSSSSFSSQPSQTSRQMPHTLADCLRVVSQDVGLLAEFDYLRSQLTPEQKAAAAARIAAAAAPQPASHPPDNSEDLDADV